MIQIYKPNPSNTGCAFSFSLGFNKTGEPCVYVNGVKQASWNAQTKKGSFAENAKDPEKSLALKFNEFELGGFIRAIENYEEYKAFHTFEQNQTSISFKPYAKRDGGKAFSFGVTRNSTLKFGVGIELSEAIALREFFQYCLREIFTYRTNQRNSQ